jgi:dCTP diphosphatase
MDTKGLTLALKRFADDRDWVQFHSPKNIATAISIEASELLEIFQWTRGSQSWSETHESAVRDRIEEELADVFLYLLRFSDLAGVDLESAAWKKLQKNADKYPVETFKGSDKKYNE